MPATPTKCPCWFDALAWRWSSPCGRSWLHVARIQVVSTYIIEHWRIHVDGYKLLVRDTATCKRGLILLGMCRRLGSREEPLSIMQITNKHGFASNWITATLLIYIYIATSLCRRFLFVLCCMLFRALNWRNARSLFLVVTYQSVFHMT